MSENTAQLRLQSGREWRKWISSLLVIAALAVGIVYLVGGPQVALQKTRVLLGIGPRSEGSAPIDALREEQVVCDEVIAVDAGGLQARGFTIRNSAAVKVTVEGVNHTANGFSVYFIDSSEWENLKTRRQFRSHEFFSGKKINALNETHRVPAGSYYLVASNSENWFNTMQVKVKIVLTPAD